MARESTTYADLKGYETHQSRGENGPSRGVKSSRRKRRGGRGRPVRMKNEFTLMVKGERICVENTTSSLITWMASHFSLEIAALSFSFCFKLSDGHVLAARMRWRRRKKHHVNVPGKVLHIKQMLHIYITPKLYYTFFTFSKTYQPYWRNVKTIIVILDKNWNGKVTKMLFDISLCLKRQCLTPWG